MIVVRPAREADEGDLARIDLATWTPAVSPAPPPADAGTHRFFGDRAVPADVLVAEVDGVVAGVVTLQPPTPLVSDAHVLQVDGLAVDPELQGRGVGGRLLEAAVQEAERRGARRLTLRVLGHNTAARRLYERHGFRTEGVLRAEFHLLGRYVDDVLMARDLVVPARE